MHTDLVWIYFSSCTLFSSLSFQSVQTQKNCWSTWHCFKDGVS